MRFDVLRQSAEQETKVEFVLFGERLLRNSNGLVALGSNAILRFVT
jgi:hypothetical protein